MKNHLLPTRYLLTETDPSRLKPSLAEVTFVGRSNVGKSSLLCALCQNKKLARVSNMPGRTRGVNVFETKRDRWMVDLPGYGYAAAPQKEREYWPKMIGRYLSGRPNMKRVYVLIDAERGVGPIDLSLMVWLRDKNLSCRIVGTKTDRLSFSRQNESRGKMAGALGLLPDEIFWVSTKTGNGLNELRGDVVDALQLI